MITETKRDAVINGDAHLRDAARRVSRLGPIEQASRVDRFVARSIALTYADRDNFLVRVLADGTTEMVDE